MAQFGPMRGPPPHGTSSQVPWYVFSVESGLPRAPGFMAYVAVQTAQPRQWIRNRPGAGIAAGPFKSQGSANNWIDQKTGLAPGTNPTATNQLVQEGGGTGFHIPNPISWFEQATGGILAAALEQGFIQIIKDIWAVIVGPLEIIAGVLIAIMVLAIYFKNDIATVATLAAAA